MPETQDPNGDDVEITVDFDDISQFAEYDEDSKIIHFELKEDTPIGL